MSTNMKGLVKDKPEQGAIIEMLSVPVPGENDVIVKIVSAAICGTDQHIYSWNQWAADRVPLPMVFGHEAAGEIVEMGKNVTGFKVGDRVAIETHIPCNNCFQCRTGNAHNCENMKIIGVHVPGVFSDYACIPQDCIWRISDDLSYQDASMLEPMGVAVHGVMSGDVALKNVVILGCGPIGVMAVGTAATAGATQIIAADLFDSKLDMAKKLGATSCINTGRADLVETVLGLTNNRGADVIIDYTGNVRLMEQAFGALAKGGRFTFVGLPSRPLSLDLTNAVIYKEANINGVTGRRMYETWYQCAQILDKGKFGLSDVVGGVYALEDYQKAFEFAAQGNPGKFLFAF